MNKKMFAWIVWAVVLIGIFFVASAISLSVGTVNFSPRELISVITQQDDETLHAIVTQMRLPRILLGLAVGGGLSLVGVLLQGMFRNPLVEPYTLGISGGACLGVCLSIVLRANRVFGFLALPVAGFLGAGLVIWFLYNLSIRKGILQIKGVLLSGVMISYITSSLIMLIMAVSHTEDLHGIVMWTMGSLAATNWGLVKLVFFVSILGLILSHFFCISLNAFSLGEEHATHLGINVERTKKLIFLVTSLLTGFFVAIAGIIGFVGLVVPHFMRLLVGQDHRILIISSFLAGGAFLIFCDMCARTVIAPLELPVGVITGILGGSLFLYALARKYKEL
ncbi:MAG: iron ABC transporter permease [Candidatus Omnitrophota bacterium]|nr:MAG: iron ABC transporter permease [Candidatus Omnitrophota bacterium]